MATRSLALAERLREVPLWVFPGNGDLVIPVEDSRRLISALEALGAPARYTELTGVRHKARDPMYQSAEVIEWLFGHRPSDR